MIKTDTSKTLEERSFDLAIKLAQTDLVMLDSEFDIFSLTDLLIATQREREEKELYTDSLIDYNDEIISIEDIGELETIDISVSGDNLFYCNDILTKNSFGVPAIADWFCAIINTDELKEIKQIMLKQLKNRYRSLDDPNKFILGIDYSQMRMFSLEDNTPKFKAKDKTQKKSTDTGNFDLDMLHTIKPKTANFADFNFD